VLGRALAFCSVVVPAFAALVLIAPASSAEPPQDPVSWTSYGYDNQLGNAVPTKVLTLAAVPQLRPRWSLQLDGPVYASPLAARVDGEQLVFAATEAGTVYAVDAADGRIGWQRNLGTVETAECGTWGITATGTIDLRRSLLFEISADGVLHALDLATGNEADGYPLPLVANNRYEYVWGGLRIANRRLYVASPRTAMPAPPEGRCRKGAYSRSGSSDRPKPSVGIR
jgi:outer membrane protein assembly factor BamB